MTRGISRRELLTGAGSVVTAGLLTACGSSTVATPLAPTAPPDPGTVFDVIVVGAGSAGIGAARAVRSYGRSVVLLEAQGRPGGRALTDNTTFSEIPFDLGAQFFGHVLSGNVLYEIARARKLPNIVDFSTFKAKFYLGPEEALERDVTSFITTTGEMLTSIFATGASIAKPSEDVPVSNVTNPFLKDRYYENAIGINVTVVTGALPPASSALDLFHFLEGSPSPFITPGDSYVIKGGMGNFIQSLANGLPLRLHTLVKRISYDGTGVSVETNKGTYRAKTAIVTVPPAVLAAGGIEFSPALPTPTQEAIGALPLGNIYKAALGFKTDIFSTFKGMTPVTQLSQEPTITYFAKFWGTNVVEFLADAKIADEIEAMSTTGQQNYLLKRLEMNFPGAAPAFDGRITASKWRSNPYSHGAYSYAKVGMSEARTQLRNGVDNRIFFAGEAVALTTSITLLQGAYTSGIAAATGALRAIGVNIRTRGPLA